MKVFIKYAVLAFVLVPFLIQGQTKSNLKLEKQIAAYNDALQYEKSIVLLTTILSDEDTSEFDKYYAFLLKSYTYKRLFNYPKTLEALDKAYTYGIKSDKKEEVKNTILAQKSFLYFDTREYKKAQILMNELALADYKYISPDDKSWIVMQEGYLFFLDKNYIESEKKYDSAIEILAQCGPNNLPNVYGKKIQLYNEMKLPAKRDAAFNKGLQIAIKYKKIKYQLYLYEILTDAFQKNNDFKNAFLTQQKFDSIGTLYNNAENSGKLEIIEQNLEKEKQKLTLKNEKLQKYILYGFVIFLIGILYFMLNLYRSNKQRRILAEIENTKMYNDIERLTKELDEKGNSKMDLSKFNLSSRQLEIITAIQNGFSNKEIANQLYISENTVKYHLKVIYEILDIGHRNEIV